jgi:hypothetical protein
MPYAKHQIRVRLKDKLTHSSGTANYNTALARCTDEIIAAGVGAIGRVYEYAQNNGNKPPVETQMRPLYEGRLVYDHAKQDGSTAIVEEDHSTPPPGHG